MPEIDVTIGEMISRRDDLESTMRYIESQQSALDIHRSRIEGKISEIEYLIRRLGEIRKENVGTKLPVIPPGSSQYHGTRT